MASRTRVVVPSQQPLPARPDPGLVQVRSAGTMGKGLFVMRDISRGTRIIDEDPLFVIYDRPLGDEMDALEQDVDAFCRTAQDLPDDKLKKLDRLYYDAEYDTARDKDRIRDWHVAAGIRDEHGRPLNGRSLAYATMVMARRYTIFRDNGARVGADDTGEDAGVFPLYSRINHGCHPNAHPHYNTTTERLTVHATRDMEAGEQVFVSYSDLACQPREARQLETKKFGFVCKCPACTHDHLSESLRLRLYRLEQGLMRHVDKDPHEGVIMPATPRLAVDWVETLISLLKRPDVNLLNSTLSNAYRTAFKIHLGFGEYEKASEYARKDLELTILLIGTDDTNHLRGEDKSVDQMQFWFRYLEELHDFY